MIRALTSSKVSTIILSLEAYPSVGYPVSDAGECERTLTVHNQLRLICFLWVNVFIFSLIVYRIVADTLHLFAPGTGLPRVRICYDISTNPDIFC